MRLKQTRLLAASHNRDQHSTPLPSVQLPVVIVPVDTGAGHSQKAASSKVSASQAPLGLSGPAEADTQLIPEAWDSLPAPAIVQIGTSLPQHTAVMLRLVCKAWATHLGDVITEAAPSPYSVLAHETAGSAGMNLLTGSMLPKRKRKIKSHLLQTVLQRHLHSVAGKNNTVLAHIMRERIRWSQQDSEEAFSQMVDSLSKHPGLQAAFNQQITDALTSWHAGLNNFFTSCPFLTRLDLSKCAAIVSEEDYRKLALTPSASGSTNYWPSEQAASARAAAEAGQVVHPCATAVTNQQALPLSIKQLLAMLKGLPCLAMLHLCLTKVVLLVDCTVAVCYHRPKENTQPQAKKF